MFGTYVFYASDGDAQKACQEAVTQMNAFTREARIGRDHLLFGF